MDLENKLNIFSESNQQNSEAAVTENAHTTHFVENELKLGNERNTPSLDSVVVFDQAIADFLGKPCLVLDTTWTTARIAGESLISADPIYHLANYAPWANKVEGYSYFRGTVHIKIQINATPFHAGKLLLSFEPSNRYRSWRYTMLSQSRQLPCVELDCREITAELSVPYVSPYEFAVLADIKAGTDFTSTIGNYSLNVLSPLVTGTGAPTSVPVTVWLWWTDVELAGPVKPQMAGKTLRRYKAASYTRNAEQPALQETPVASALMKASKVCASATDIPVIGGIAEPLSWAARIGSGIASAFGWSKAVVETPTTIVANQVNRYAATSTGVDTAIPLAVVSDNKVRPMTECSLTNEDEMSLSFLNDVMTLTATTVWNSTDVVDTTLGSTTVSPKQMYKVETVYTTGTPSRTLVVNSGPPVFFLANQFRYWRGSLRYVFKLVKTQFHTGRLLITYTPRSITPPLASESTFSIRHIWDISSESEIEIKIPFIYNQLYCETTGNTGTLKITVLTPLVAPPTVSQSIAFMVYCSGTNDLEFALPGDAPPAVSMQMNLGNVPNTVDTLQFAGAAIGEKVESIKQIIMRSSVLQSSKNLYNLTQLLIRPLTPGCTWYPINSTSTIIPVPELGLDNIAQYSQMYNFMRGSVIIGVNDVNAKTVISSLYTLGSYEGTLITGSNNYTGQTFSSATFVKDVGSGYPNQGWNMTQNGVPNYYHVPYYNRFKCSRTVPYSDGTTTSTFSCSAVLLQLQTLNGTFGGATDPTTTITRAAGDDFQFSYFIGAPPLYTAQPT